MESMKSILKGPLSPEIPKRSMKWLDPDQPNSTTIIPEVMSRTKRSRKSSSKRLGLGSIKFYIVSKNSEGSIGSIEKSAIGNDSGENNYKNFVKNPKTKEEKLSVYLHPYNHSVVVRPFMTFDDNEKKKEIKLRSEEIQEKWTFLTDFIFKNNHKQFRDVCYEVNKQLYSIFYVDGDKK